MGQVVQAEVSAILIALYNSSCGICAANLKVFQIIQRRGFLSMHLEIRTEVTLGQLTLAIGHALASLIKPNTQVQQQQHFALTPGAGETIKTAPAGNRGNGGALIHGEMEETIE